MQPYFNNFTFLFLLTIVWSCSTNKVIDSHYKTEIIKTDQAKFVWVDDTGGGRHQYVYFSRSFDLDNVPKECIFNLFADSRYLLKVNGVDINWGPGRYYPEEIEYDSHDISPYLQKGKNIITVKVLSNGMSTYQLLQTSGGFIAWGNIQSGQNNIDLVTPGKWKCIKATGYDQTAPKMTFAQGAFDAYDARIGIDDWDKIDTDRSQWKNVVVLQNQKAWGKLSPRSIPLLTQDEVLPLNVDGVYKLKDDEDVHSFRITIPDATGEEYEANPWIFGYTYIYSPIDQDIEVGLWWGEHFLNGKALSGKPAPNGINRRSNVTLHLKKGWNYYFEKYGVVWSHWEFSMILPKNAGLILSPTKKLNSPYFMMSAGPFTDDEDQLIKKLNLPFAPEELPKLSKSWVGHIKGDHCNNPSVSIAYSYFDKKIDHEPTKVTDIALDDKSGNAIIYDMGKNTYGRIFIEYTAPEGTIVDIGWAEDKDGDRLHILKRFALYMSARHIAKEGYNYFEVFKPNGHKLIQVNIKNPIGEVIVHKVGSIKQNYPLQDIGRFECSDRMLNQVWKLGKRTIELCADDVYTDPFRERGLYAGDLLPETTIGYVISGDTKLARKSMQQIQGLYAEVFEDYSDNLYDRHHIDVLSDFPLLTLVNLKWYYDLTGDITFLKYSYPKYKRMMDSLAVTQLDNGLFDEVKSFIEWSKIEKGNAQLATTQSLMSKSFDIIGDMAILLGYIEDGNQYKSISKSSAKAVASLMWDEDKKAYFDGYKSGKKIDSYYPLSSAWPVIFDVSDDSQHKYINQFLIEELDSIGNSSRNNKITPYGSFYGLGALYKMENAKTAEWFMRKYWQNMVFEDNDCVWENFGSEGGQGSKSHGWSGAPTWYLSTYVLGVQLGFPEYTDMSYVTISPQSETINWAKGIVPHPTGNVKVDWKVIGDNFFLNYQVNQGVEVKVKPKGRLAQKILWVNGVRQ
ncbi:MAG: alpha-L-rhamnosidase N-terminal domain-containing protein [Saprospiraceae bacterium]